MNRREAAIVSAYTGVLIGEFSDFHEYVEQLLDRQVWTHELGSRKVAAIIKELSRPDFVGISVSDDMRDDHNFIYTKRHNREDCRLAWVHPPPHTVMDRWVRCHVVGDKVVLGPVLKETLSSTSRAALERMAEKEIFGKGVGVHEKRERAPGAVQR